MNAMVENMDNRLRDVFRLTDFLSLDGKDTGIEALLFATGGRVDPRLRNQIIANAYAELSRDLAVLIYGSRLNEPDLRIPPNFYTLAYWGATTVGMDLQSTRRPGARRRGRAIESGNAEVARTVGQVGNDFIRLFDNDHNLLPEGKRLAGLSFEFNDEPSDAEEIPEGLKWIFDKCCGVPPEIRGRVDSTTNTLTFVDPFRDLSKRHYVAAAAGDDLETKNRNVLLGTAWLAVGEQAMVNEAVAVALRINCRTWLHPIQAFRKPHRRFERLRPSGWRAWVESFWVRVVTRSMVNFAHPKGLMGRGKVSNLRRWYTTERREAARKIVYEKKLGLPFTAFFPKEGDIPDLTAWSCYQERMRVILAMLLLYQESAWLTVNSQNVVEHSRRSPWSGYKKWLGYYTDVLMPDQQPADERST